MTYIPVGTRLTYTAQINTAFYKIFQTPADIIAKLNTDLKNLPGAEEFDIENSSASAAVFGSPSISITVLNNGVDHGSETDVQSIIDGTLQAEGVQVISSDITQIQLPNNPLDDNSGEVIQTGATPSQLPATPNTAGLGLGGLQIPSLSTGTKLLTSGTIIIIAIIALIFLLPGGFARSLKAVRR